jgi:hypothetical protein
MSHGTKNYHQKMFDNTTPDLKIEIKVGLSRSLSEIITSSGNSFSRKKNACLM